MTNYTMSELLSEFSNTEIKWDNKKQLYYFSFMFRGNRYYRQSYKWKTRNKKLAENARDKLIQSLLDGESIKLVKFESIVKEYFKFLNVRENTKANKKQIVDKFILPTFSSRDMKRITSQDIRAFSKKLLSLNYKRDNKDIQYSNDQLKRIQNELSSIFDFALVNNYIKINPCLKIPIMKHNTIQHKKKFRKLDYNDVYKVIDCTSKLERYKHEIKVALLISRFHGLRPSELIGLEIGHVNFVDKAITIEQSYDTKSQTINPTKNKKARVNFTNDIVLDAIREMIDSYKDYEYNDHTPLIGLRRFPKTTLDTYRKKAIELAGVNDFTWYDLRHNHATELYELGFKPTDIAERLGHDETETLNTYIIRDVKEQKKMLEMIQKSNKSV